MTARLGADRLIGFWLNAATQSATEATAEEKRSELQQPSAIRIEGHVFALPSVDCRHPSSVGMGGCLLPRLRARRKASYCKLI
jgi:hypothetical protein